MPSAIEQINPSTHQIAYEVDRTNKGLIFGILIYMKCIILIFSQGTLLPDPESLLTAIGKRARHLRISTLVELDNPALWRLLQTAIALKFESLKNFKVISRFKKKVGLTWVSDTSRFVFGDDLN